MNNLSLKRGINFSYQEEDFDYDMFGESEDFDEADITEIKPKKPRLKFKFLVAS